MNSILNNFKHISSLQISAEQQPIHVSFDKFSVEPQYKYKRGCV